MNTEIVEQVSSNTPEAGTAPATGAAANRDGSRSGNMSLEQLTSTLKNRVAPGGQSKPAAAPGAVSSGETIVANAAGAEALDEASSGTGEAPVLPGESTPSEQAAETPGDPNQEVEEVAETEGGEGEEAVDPAEPNSVRKMQKRISSVVKQRNDERTLREHTERQNAELRAQLAARGPAEAGATGAPRVSTEGFDQNPEVRALNESLAQVEQVIAWADEHMDGAEITGKDGQTVQWTAAQVRAYRSRAEGQRVEFAANRAAKTTQLAANVEAQRAQFNAEAVKYYPWQADKNSPDFQRAVAVLRNNPHIAAQPNAAMIVGDYIRGLNARLAEQAAPKAAKPLGTPMMKPTSGKPPTPVVTRPAATAPKVDPKQKGVTDAESNFKKSGSVKDLTNLFATKQRARAVA